MIQLLSKGAAGSFSLEKLGPRMLRRDFDPGFYVEHFVKDLGIVLDESERMGLQVPGTTQAAELYRKMIDKERGRMGTQGLLTILEEMNNCQVKTYN